MKHRPNISVQQKSNTKLEYLKYLAEENIQPNVSVPTFVAPTGKQKSKPNLNIQKRNLDKVNQHRIDMMQWVNREVPVIADLLIEYSTYYVLTITSYKLLFNNELTISDFLGSSESRGYPVNFETERRGYKKGLCVCSKNTIPIIPNTPSKRSFTC
jgi:hypothetical protein